MMSEPLLYFPLNMHVQNTSWHVFAPLRDRSPANDLSLTAFVLSEPLGSMLAGLYIKSGNVWRYALSQFQVSEMLTTRELVDVYVGPITPITVALGCTVYKNGVLTADRILQGASSIFVVITPASVAPPADLTLIAGRNISGHRVVKASRGKADYASSAVRGDANKVIGISKGAALAGAVLNVQTEGEMMEPSWNWDVDLPVFNGVDGLLTQSNPSTGYSLVVGIPVSPTILVVAIKQPIIV